MAASGKALRGRSYGGVASEERRAERRRRLLAAGVRAFGRDGYAGTTTRSLCAEAGLTQRYFYEAFDGLEALFIEVARTLAEDLKRAILEAITRVPREPEPMIRAALTTYFEALRDDPAKARIGLVEAFTVSPGAELLARGTIEELAGILHATLDSFDGLERRDPASTRLLSIGIVGATHHIALTWMLGGFREPVAALVETTVLLYRALIPADASTSSTGAGADASIARE